MAIPTQTEMFGIVLALMGDGKEHTRKGIKQIALEHLKLTDEEAREITDSGVPVYESRVGWSVSYLSRAQLLDRVSRGVYVINDQGKSVIGEKLDPAAMWARLNGLIYELDPWKKNTEGKSKKTKEPSAEAPTKVETASPLEQIASLASELDADLADELLALIMDHDSDFFERVVVQLLEKMGYGRGTVTKHSSDGGIDGLITTDELGFRPICTQAKRYKAGHKVGRPEVQSFVGALNGANNGVFITTSSFTAEAVEYAKNYPNATLSLIDGRQLTKLMIKYNLGVATENVIEIKRIDSDYFEE